MTSSFLRITMMRLVGRTLRSEELKRPILAVLHGSAAANSGPGSGPETVIQRDNVLNHLEAGPDENAFPIT